MITQDDAGRTYTIAVGQEVDVELSGSGSDPWGSPTDSNTAALSPRPSGVMPCAGCVYARYQGAAAGQAVLSAQQTPTCRQATPPCGGNTREFSVTINVSG
ncbi:MAG: hypothetical protein ACYDH6_24685 [Acidimicrobiales bacterium]